MEPIVRDHRICQGCGSDDPGVEAGGIYGCPNRHCLAAGAWNSRMRAGYQDAEGRTSPAQALKWREDLLADLLTAAEDGDPKRLAMMARSARRVANHLREVIPGLVDEVRVAEALSDGWDLAEAMREYHGEDQFKARLAAGVVPDVMAVAALRRYAEVTREIRGALERMGFTASDLAEHFPGKSTLEAAAELIHRHALEILDAERRWREGPAR